MADYHKNNEKPPKIEGFHTTTYLKSIEGWISLGFKPETITYAEVFSLELAKPRLYNKKRDNYSINVNQALTTSQIRNFFGEVRRIQMQGFDEVSIMMLKPRLAYASKRKETIGSKSFEIVMQKALDAVLSGEDDKEKEKRFKRFADFFEAILAYHRANGGS